MKGLFYKDVLMLTRSFRAYLAMTLFFIILATIRPDNSFWAVYGTFFFVTLVSSLMAVDEQSRWLSYCDILPLKRRDIINERYLLSLILTAALVVLFLILSLIFRHADMPTVLVTAGMMVALSLLAISVSMPINVKFGTAKGQMVRMTVIIVMVACGMFIINYAGPITAILLQVKASVLLFGIAAFIVLIFALSWLLSIRIYEKKNL
ncbi:MAG: ABC-2 transporter permease [Solobacterium sp.]|nr:ABC-2 transporter permease [Solobacterium sp.]